MVERASLQVRTEARSAKFRDLSPIQAYSWDLLRSVIKLFKLGRLDACSIADCLVNLVERMKRQRMKTATATATVLYIQAEMLKSYKWMDDRMAF